MKKILGPSVVVLVGLVATVMAGGYSAFTSPSSVPWVPPVTISASPAGSETPPDETKELVYIEIEASAVQNGEDRPIPDDSEFTVELSKDGKVFFSQKIRCFRDGKLVWQPTGLKGFSPSDMIAVRVTGTLNGQSMAGNQTFNPVMYGRGVSIEGTMQLKPVETAPAPSPKG